MQKRNIAIAQDEVEENADQNPEDGDQVTDDEEYSDYSDDYSDDDEYSDEEGSWGEIQKVMDMISWTRDVALFIVFQICRLMLAKSYSTLKYKMSLKFLIA